MARTLGLGRLAVDGLRIAAHLLGPGDPAGMPGDLDASIELARRLDFPWDIADCLNTLKTAVPAGDDDYGTRDGKPELSAPSGIPCPASATGSAKANWCNEMMNRIEAKSASCFIAT